VKEIRVRPICRICEQAEITKDGLCMVCTFLMHGAQFIVEQEEQKRRKKSLLITGIALLIASVIGFCVWSFQSSPMPSPNFATQEKTSQ